MLKVETGAMEELITNAVDTAIQQQIATAIDQLILNDEWIKKIEGLVNVNISQKIERQLSNIDLQSLLAENIDGALDRYSDRIRELAPKGIEDNSSEVQLNIEDNVVVAKNNFVTQNIEATNDVTVNNTLTVDHLIVRKDVNVDNKSWDEISNKTYHKVIESITDDFKAELVTSVLDHSNEYGIEFDTVLIGGEPLFTGNQLNARIQRTGIISTGKLENLEVAGETNLNETMHVVKKRVGINTDRPENTLSVWDEEVSIGIGKLKKNTAFIGTSKKNSLTLGVNGEPAISVDENGRIFANNLTIDRWQIGFEPQAPGHLGTRGDIVFNSNPKEGSPFGWVCTGNFNWKAIMGN